MKTMKKGTIATKIVFVTMLMIIVCTGSAYAASVCNNVSGNSRTTSTFYVCTGKGWTNNQYITIDQKKGVMKYENWVGRTKTFSMPGMYCIDVRDLNRGVTKGYDMDTTWAVKIKLRAKTKYRITVSPKPMSTLRGKYFYKGYLIGWQKHSTWTVKKTKNVTLCR